MNVFASVCPNDNGGRKKMVYALWKHRQQSGSEKTKDHGRRDSNETIYDTPSPNPQEGENVSSVGQTRRNEIKNEIRHG